MVYVYATNEIINTLKNLDERIKKKYGIKKIYLIGSYARDEADENSDIDILIEFEGKYSPLKELEFQTYLYTIFKKKVEVMDKRHIHDEFIDIILNQDEMIEII